MKTIPLSTQGKKKGQFECIVDNSDYKSLCKNKWSVRPGHKTNYAYKTIKINVKRSTITMHQIIMSSKPGEQIDHINGNGLDNRRKNLRICTASQNRMNRGLQINNQSGAKGVDWMPKRNKWRARIQVGGKQIHLGVFKNKIDAIKKYNSVVVKIHKEFAVKNKL